MPSRADAMKGRGLFRFTLPLVLGFLWWTAGVVVAGSHILSVFVVVMIVMYVFFRLVGYDTEEYVCRGVEFDSDLDIYLD